MNRMLFRAVMLVVPALGVACGGAHEDDDAARTRPASPVDTPSAKAASEPLYFGVTNRFTVAGDLLAAVDLQAGASVQLEAVTADGSPIRFEVWRVHQDGHVELVNAFDVASGFVLTDVDAPSDGRALIHFPAPGSPRDVVIHLDCDRAGARCTPTMQPGEPCFNVDACAAGLACVPADGACDGGFSGGTCGLPGYTTTCEDEATASLGGVCGCDGRTYGTACLARASGAGVRAIGPCTTPPRAPS
jgi:hypothetical protein